LSKPTLEVLATDSKQGRTAFALSCGADNETARCLISGRNELADLIIQYAKASNIPIEENQTLAKMLESERNQSCLSSKAVQVLAEVIAALYEVEQKAA
jgi:type III secretion system FlhB-like substrate exporter